MRISEIREKEKAINEELEKIHFNMHDSQDIALVMALTLIAKVLFFMAKAIVFSRPDNR